MDAGPLTGAELTRLDELNKFSHDSEFLWAKARLRSLSSQLRKVQTELNGINDAEDLKKDKQ